MSQFIGDMPFLWLEIADAPGPESLRGCIERNSVALLSNYAREPMDAPSDQWLGRFSHFPKVIKSGLWNSNHVDEEYSLSFLETLAELVSKTK